jgi:hypothetical protein
VKILSQLKHTRMKTLKIISVLALSLTGLFVACSDNDPSPSDKNPIVIPVQTTTQTSVTLGSTASLAVLAGSSVTSTGATTVTGDMGLSPGSSIGGFPPGILNGAQHINDATSDQAKLDLTAAYNDLAGRTSTDIVTLSGNIGGLTLTPGLYKSTSSLAISSGDLTFDA